MSKPSTDLHGRIRGLEPLRFQRLAITLARRVYGDTLEEVRDTDGEGNGCDGILEDATAVRAFQARTFKGPMGDSQRRKIKKAIELASTKIPIERKKPLERMTFLFNIDLSPSESRWLAKIARDLLARERLTVDYHGLSWLADKLLAPGNDGLRREYVETEFDRQDGIVKLLEELRVRPTPELAQSFRAQLLSEVHGLDLERGMKDALVTLVERAHHHYAAGLNHVTLSFFHDAIRALDEALVLLARHQAVPLYRDLIYWRAVALVGASRWAEGLTEFERAESFYKHAGLEDEAHYAHGNRGHALFGLGKLQDALRVFEGLQDYWVKRRDLVNVTTGRLNIAMSLVALNDNEKALKELERSMEELRRLAPGPREFISHYQLACAIAGNAAIVCCRLEDYQQALGKLEVAIELAELCHDEHLAARLRTQSAEPLREMGRHLDAKAALVTARRVFEERGDKLNLSVVFNALALGALAEGNSAVAITYLEQDAKLCRDIGDERGLRKTEVLMDQILSRG